MGILYKLLIVFIALLSIVAGVAKVMLTPQEVQFLESFDFNAKAIICFGAFQIVAGSLLFCQKV
jgi:uncharacterized membrane protein HdeD (DUF308 family)